jgi:RNA polymerase sigma-70 factor (ECF subfamily)
MTTSTPGEAPNVPSDQATHPDALLAEARAGNSGALGRLLDQYHNYLTLLARLRIGMHLQGKVDPADVVQETFLSAHRDFASFRGQTEGEFLGWLRRILALRLATVVRHYLGTQGRDVLLERDLAEELEQSSRWLAATLVAPGSSPSHQAARREQAVLLADALAALPPNYREVIILRNVEELTFPEVAARMGRTLDSVKKLWTRGLGQLRQEMGANLASES